MKTSFLVEMKKHERNIRWKRLGHLIFNEDILELIMSDQIASPWEFLRLAAGSPRIESTDGLITLLAIRKANLSGYSEFESCFSKCNWCKEMTPKLAITNKLTSLPFGIESEKNLFSFVTCSGPTDQRYTLGIILAPFHWII